MAEATGSMSYASAARGSSHFPSLQLPEDLQLRVAACLKPRARVAFLRTSCRCRDLAICSTNSIRVTVRVAQPGAAASRRAVHTCMQQLGGSIRGEQGVQRLQVVVFGDNESSRRCLPKEYSGISLAGHACDTINGGWRRLFSRDTGLSRNPLASAAVQASMGWDCTARLHKLVLCSVTIGPLDFAFLAGACSSLRFMKLDACNVLPGRGVHYDHYEYDSCDGDCYDGSEVDENGCELLTSSLGALTMLEELEVVDCGECVALPDTLGLLVNLRKLVVASSGGPESWQYGSLPQAITKLGKLEVLDVSTAYDGSVALPHNFGALSSLHTLALPASNYELPASFTALAALRHFTLRRKSDEDGGYLHAPRPDLCLDDDFEVLSVMASITRLDFVELGVLTIPECLSAITALQHLDLSENRELTCLPCSSSTLANLRVLNLCGCWDLDLSPVYALTGITCLDLSYNFISTLEAQQLTALTALEELILSHQGEELQSVPACFTCLSALRSLRLHGCRYTDVVSACCLTGLTLLDIGGCNITKLPQSFSSLTALRHLDLSENWGLQCLPAWFTCLSKVTYLNLSGCRMLHIPECLSALTALEHLTLRMNKQLQAVPEWLADLPALDHVDLTGCGHNDALVVPERVALLCCRH